MPAALTDIAPPATSGAPTGNDYGNHEGGLYPVGVGYDMATGLGTPLAAGPGGLADQLCAMRAPVTQAPRLSSLTPDQRSGRRGDDGDDRRRLLPAGLVGRGRGESSDRRAGAQLQRADRRAPGGQRSEEVTVTTSHGDERTR